VEVKEQYHVKISSMFEASENFDDKVDRNRVSEIIRQNMRA
jgi:hypothetical protein